ncbi:hypothetical protein AR457_16490 [Streptomyces agglomeratus]|nr:hypothetical protein BGK70_20160 [Streptomyces agglomeratus]OEJ45492.1 hypothetical protein AR457_16490 [Streptomyces agglomeratus]
MLASRLPVDGHDQLRAPGSLIQLAVKVHTQKSTSETLKAGYELKLSLSVLFGEFPFDWS